VGKGNPMGNPIPLGNRESCQISLTILGFPWDFLVLVSGMGLLKNFRKIGWEIP